MRHYLGILCFFAKSNGQLLYCFARTAEVAVHINKSYENAVISCNLTRKAHSPFVLQHTTSIILPSFFFNDSITGMLSAFSSKVTMVIDHHQGNSPTLTQEGVASIIELVGSCSTLVSRKLLNDSNYKMEESVARALVSVILSDTGKLLAEGRETDQDKEAVKDLSKFLPSTFDNSEQYAKYMTAKFDISTLSVREVLERDFKQEGYGSRYVIGFCSITAKLSEYLTRSSTKEDIAEFYRTHSLTALVMFGVTIKTMDPMELEKQIAVYQPEGAHSEFTESLVAMLESNKDIHCERLEGLEEFEGVIMHQGNHTLSRKQMVPFFTEFMISMYEKSECVLM